MPESGENLIPDRPMILINLPFLYKIIEWVLEVNDLDIVFYDEKNCIYQDIGYPGIGIGVYLAFYLNIG